MKIIKLKSDNIVIYAGDNLTLSSEGVRGDDFIHPSLTSDVAVIESVTDLPFDFAASHYTHSSGVWTKTPDGITSDQVKLSVSKTAKNLQINEWRGEANQTFFPYLGKTIACDALSRSDIDAVANSVSLTGAFPVGFPNAWKTRENTYVMLPTVQAFKDMYAAMTAQGTTNFNRSQTLKSSLASATTQAQIDAIVWA